MPLYRLRCTRQNPDGSFEIPLLDVELEAHHDREAEALARRFPRHAFGDDDIIWVVDHQGRIVWSATEGRHFAA